MSAGADLPAAGRRLPLLALPFAGGAGLVVYILAGISLPAAAGAVALLGAVVWRLVASDAPEVDRRAIAARVRAGAVAGLLAVAAYDLVRFGLVSLLTLEFEPFHVIPRFGRLFVGDAAPEAVAVAAGVAYHVANGIGFAVGYALAVRRPGPLTGVAWGVGLELCMAVLYPTWLAIATLEEFLTVSALGHLAYGAVLGLAMRAQVGR
ncbi:MAG TPA: hypothetical protein VHF89_02675 [Solirubrobacteraceae bacterium]|nr:hypothetical protein [Solirubrobacteraceae bacterium]